MISFLRKIKLSVLSSALICCSVKALEAKDLQIVSHQDDDFLFMNPDMENAIKAGHKVQTVYVTSGDAGLIHWNDGYLSLNAPGVLVYHWQLRELGTQAAYAKMAGVANVWTAQKINVLGKDLDLYTLRDAPNVTIIYMRLPDGNPSGTGYSETCNTSLEKLWKHESSFIPKVNASNFCQPQQFESYSREQLIEVLTKLIKDYSPNIVRTLDSTGIYGNDHSDHKHSALFTLEALHASNKDINYKIYRGYNISSLPVNLTNNDRNIKWNSFLQYAAFDMCKYPRPSQPNGGADPNTCEVNTDYTTWGYRMYSISAVKNRNGKLQGLGGKCLDVRGAQANNGTNVQIWDCVNAPQQEWKLTSEGYLQGLGGKCLDVRGGSDTNGTAVQIWDCVNVPQQKWTLMDNGLLRGISGKCLDVRGAQANNGTNVQIWDCVDAPQQKWGFQ